MAHFNRNRICIHGMTYNELSDFLLDELASDPQLGQMLFLNALKVLGEWGVIYEDALKYTSRKQLLHYMEARAEAALTGTSKTH